jgi:hypothetical protein
MPIYLLLMTISLPSLDDEVAISIALSIVVKHLSVLISGILLPLFLECLDDIGDCCYSYGLMPGFLGKLSMHIDLLSNSSSPASSMLSY